MATKKKASPKKAVAAAKPEKFGKEVDALYAMGLKIDQEQARINKLKEQYDAAEALLFEQMDKQGVTSLKGKLGIAYVSETVVPQTEDWEKALKYIVAKKEFDLLTRKVNSKGWRDRLAAGEKIPGIESFTRRTLHCKKAS